jgi:hypothetical protein
MIMNTSRAGLVLSLVLLALLMTGAGALIGAEVPFSPVPRKSSLVASGSDGLLTYNAYTERGDVLPDFSRVGYRKGEKPLPEVPVRISLKPAENGVDDTARIQNAIDQVSAMAPDEDGFRGAVLLERGLYRVRNTLRIEQSGVVLRGEGSGEDGTILFADDARAYTVIVVGQRVVFGGGAPERVEVPGTRQAITDEYVPVGSFRVNVADGSLFSAGDRVVVERPATQEWIDDIGMGPDGLMASRGGTPWEPSEYTLSFEREVEKVEGDTVVLDIPLVQSLDQNYGGGYLYRFQFPRIVDSGVEHLRIESDFDRSHTATLEEQNMEGSGDPARLGQTFYTDSNHARTAVIMDAVEHGWVRNVTAVYFSYSTVSLLRRSAHITVTDCAYLDGASPLSGGWRYSFNVNGQKNLVRDSYSFRARHSFVLGPRTPGPNVFYNCLAEEAYLMSEPHHRWAAGVLFDNVVSYGGSLWAVNRGASGTGHGWSGANIVFWNSTSALIAVQRPPTAQNFAIGLGQQPDQRPIDVSWISWQSGEPIELRPDTPAHGSGFIEHPHNPVEPRSLYQQQVWDRYGGGPPPLVTGEATYTDSDVVIGLAMRESLHLGYTSGGGNGQVGSGGNLENRRHQNPVIGFALPDLPADDIVSFALTISRSGSRNDHGVDLYGLIPEDPSTYTDGSITSEPDGVDVWYQGDMPDNRTSLIGAVWKNFIPAGSPAGAIYDRDVTEFIRGFYNADGPIREKVYFRLSPGVAVEVTALARTDIDVRQDVSSSPSLSFVARPQEAAGMPSFDEWRQIHFSEEARLDDTVSGSKATPAGDGVPNLIKYAMNRGPMDRIEPRELIFPDPTGVEFFRYRVRVDVQDLQYTVWVSPDLLDWRTGPDHIQEIDRAAHEDPFEQVTVRALIPDGSNRAFARLEIEWIESPQEP